MQFIVMITWYAPRRSAVSGFSISRTSNFISLTPLIVILVEETREEEISVNVYSKGTTWL